MRATCPLFTILIYRVFFSRRYAMITYASIVPVMLGVGLATFGDYYFTTIGFTLTLIGVVLAAVKVRCISFKSTMWLWYPGKLLTIGIDCGY
jgi:hypothetical protein